MTEPASSSTPEAASLREMLTPRFGRAESHYVLTRFVLLRGLALIYWVAFLIALLQFRPLFGQRGLLPAAQHLDWVASRVGSRSGGFYRLPSLFWLEASDAALYAGALLGAALSLLALFGFSSALSWFVLWALYLSFVNVGQIFYGYGWESLLCEAGFLAIFLAPALDPRAFSWRAPPERLVLVLYRWLVFRVMFGARLIKLRGDPCWTELTCLLFHYETQPNPGPLSVYFHRLPPLAHEFGALFNHAVELIAPFGVFGPRGLRLLAGASISAFQLVLIVSGNLSFLNWLTLVLALSCLDDGVFVRVLPRSLCERAVRSERGRVESRAQRVLQVGVAIIIGLLSVDPVLNLLSPRQAMNASFEPLRLVNTYGAFGSVSRERLAAVIEGTDASDPRADARWLGYELPCQVGDPARRPCLVTPYHHRLDWQLWFVPLAGPDAAPEPWLVHLVSRLLEGDSLTLGLFRKNPFAGRLPRFVRVALYRYRFSRPGESGYWQREYLGNLLPPLARSDPELLRYIAAHHWD